MLLFRSIASFTRIVALALALALPSVSLLALALTSRLPLGANARSLGYNPSIFSPIRRLSG